MFERQECIGKWSGVDIWESEGGGLGMWTGMCGRAKTVSGLETVTDRGPAFRPVVSVY